jgi:outer membrane protein assembly factor BamB
MSKPYRFYARVFWVHVALFSLALAAGETSAQFFVPPRVDLTDAIRVDEPAPMVRNQLERVRRNIAERQWDEAIEGLRQLMENHGERLVRLDSRFISLRELGHMELVKLPAEGLALYRGRVDPQAEQWYSEGLKDRNPTLLARVVDELFASSFGDDALLALGEIALERGEYQRARELWERISPEFRTTDGMPLWVTVRAKSSTADPAVPEKPGTEPDNGAGEIWLAYPDTNISLAEVRARLILVSLHEGATERAGREYHSFVELHDGSKGRLAGREGPYRETLSALLESARQWPAVKAQEAATTFGGNAARNHVAPGEFALRSLAWSIALPQIRTGGDASGRFDMPAGTVGGLSAPISYHPIAAGNLIAFSDRDRIYVYNLQTGRPAWKQSSENAMPGQVYSREGRQVASSSALGMPRFTATVHGSYLFVRLGSQVTSWPETRIDDDNRGALVILDLAQQGKLIATVQPENDRWSFEGPPLCDGARFYIAMRYNDVRPQSHVACYELVAASGIAGTVHTPRLRWRRMICSAESPARGSIEEITHNMLTLVDGALYLNTNLGAVARLSADDGHIHWLSTYPRATASDGKGYLSRDLNPCVYYRGTLYVAPTDSPQIIAIDAMTGLVRWATLPSATDDVVHLLGVAAGSLIASGTQLWWLDAETGKVVTTFPPTMEVSQAQPRGRGLLKGDVVVWPTRHRLYVFNQKQSPSNDANTLPAMPREPILLAPYDDKISGGNLVAAGEYTLLAAADRLWAFGPKAESAAKKPQ